MPEVDAVTQGGLDMGAAINDSSSGPSAAPGGGGYNTTLADAINQVAIAPNPVAALGNQTVVSQLEADGINVADFIASIMDGEGQGSGKNPMMDPASREAAIMRSGSREGLVSLAKSGAFGKDAQDQALDASSKADQFNQSFFANVLGLSRQGVMDKSGKFDQTDLFANIDPLGILAGIVAGPVAGYLAGKASPLDIQVNLTGRDATGGGRSSTNSAVAESISGDGSGVSIGDNELKQGQQDVTEPDAAKETKKRTGGAFSEAFEKGMSKFIKLPDFDILNGVEDFLGGIELITATENGPQFEADKKDTMRLS